VGTVYSVVAAPAVEDTVLELFAFAQLYCFLAVKGETNVLSVPPKCGSGNVVVVPVRC
jgi:hypothetical protein